LDYVLNPVTAKSECECESAIFTKTPTSLYKCTEQANDWQLHKIHKC